MNITKTNFFPNNLKELPVWILWKLEEDKNGRLTKVPYSANYNGRASSTNPKTWSSYEKAVSKFESCGSEYNGIGIMISPDYRLIFVDIDHCINEDGSFDERGSELIHLSGEKQYVELSQSGTGLHLITFGEIPRSFKNSTHNVEMYNGSRFCAMTGNALTECEIHEDPVLIKILFEKYKTAEKKTDFPVHTVGAVDLEDADIVAKAYRRGGKFPLLYSGDWQQIYSSQSEADLGLCMILAFWCDRDFDQIDRIFRSSGLYREKWDRDDYRINTIASACASIRESLSEFKERQKKEFEDVFLNHW